MASRTVAIPQAWLEVFDAGTGPAAVLIQTALTADELRPLSDHPALGGVRRVRYLRRGYGGSSPAGSSGSIARDADDCVHLLDALDLPRAHLVGTSYSSAVALQVGATYSDRVDSLTLIEPPPVHTEFRDDFVAASNRLLALRREQGVTSALDAFFDLMSGADRGAEIDAVIPGAMARMKLDARTFFDADVPALLSWRFGSEDASRINAPVQLITGTASGPWFAAARDLILEWLPNARSLVVDGAGHDLPVTHPREAAGAVAAIMARA